MKFNIYLQVTFIFNMAGVQNVSVSKQLLECSICLEEYRIPKMLPCQHTFCMDDCLKNLVDCNNR